MVVCTCMYGRIQRASPDAFKYLDEAGRVHPVEHCQKLHSTSDTSFLEPREGAAGGAARHI